MPVWDHMGRGLTDLRISVTDRCNFRCTYCMPRAAFPPDHPFLAREQVLSYEEISRLAGIFTRLGVRKIRITGGEPLLRRDLHVLVGMLAAEKAIEDLSLTTNGVLLSARCRDLADAGLGRVTVSLDALDPVIFREMTDTRADVAVVLKAIDDAVAAGLGPVKVNAVLRRGINESEILPLARYFRERPVTLRFIEYMDVGATNRWKLDEVVPAKEILQTVSSEWPLEPVPDSGGVATRYRYRDGHGEIGIISSVSAPFCGTCTRARISAEGKLYTCLFASDGHDLRALLRGGSTDAEILESIEAIWGARSDRYSELRSSGLQSESRVEMSHIGG